MNNKMPPSLIKWTGSKRSQAYEIAKLFPQNKTGTYFEPFLGSGAVLFFGAQCFSQASASDIYKPLIDLWCQVKSTPDIVVDSYTCKWEALQADFPGFYFTARKQFNLCPNGLDLLFLSRTCVNGIIRFNKHGEFNNSIHLSRHGMKPEVFKRIVKHWSSILKNTSFTTRDYTEILDEVQPNDFVYMDPPYANSHNRYIADLDIGRFFTFLENLNQKNVFWALSFDGTRGEQDLTYAIPRELYKHHALLKSGNSAVQKVLNGSVERVDESLYLNYSI